MDNLLTDLYLLKKTYYKIVLTNILVNQRYNTHYLLKLINTYSMPSK